MDIYGSYLDDGLTQFRLGNIPPYTDCKVIIKVALSANLLRQNTFTIIFPLDICGPYGSIQYFDEISSNFTFQLQCDKEKINKVTTNVKNIQYDDSTKLLTIKNPIQYSDNYHSIIINFETKENIQSSVLVGSTINNYNNCAITISPNLENNQSDMTKEFIFVIDCSCSMWGLPIKRAAECLELFIRSLPTNSYLILPDLVHHISNFLIHLLNTMSPTLKSIRFGFKSKCKSRRYLSLWTFEKHFQ